MRQYYRILIFLIGFPSLIWAQTPTQAMRSEQTSAAADANQYWDDQFVPPGVAGPVYALAVAANGDLYVGGEFASAGGVAASNIARWDGRRWHALGGGADGPVRALAFLGADLYVGGDFQGAVGAPSPGLARWSGADWFPAGAGVGHSARSFSVTALAVGGDDLYVGGSFELAGGVAAGNLARWDGAAWSGVGGGVMSATAAVTPAVSSLLWHGNALYVGGSFTATATLTARNIARWDGAAWFGLSGGANGAVSALATDGTRVYAGGRFSQAGTVAADRVAAWDGQGWSAADDGLRAATSREIGALAWHGGALYAGLGGPQGDELTGVVVRAGTRWSRRDERFYSGNPLGPPSAVHALAGGARLYAGGRFGEVAGGGRHIGVMNALELRAGDWAALGNGLTESCLAGACSIAASTQEIMLGLDASVDYYPPLLFAGGGWRGTSAPPGFNAAAILATDGDTIYATDSGSYPNPSLTVAYRRPGAAWTVLPGTLPGRIFRIAAGGGVAYAVHAKPETGFVAISRWRNGGWELIGEVSGGQPGIYTLLARGSEVYIGGSFSSVNGVPAPSLARWDGAAWSSLGLPPTLERFNGARVSSLAFVGDRLHVAFGGTLNLLAARDAAGWTEIAEANHNITDLAAIGGDLYVYGYFQVIGGQSLTRLARWDGGAWHALGDGIPDGVVSRLAVHGNSLYLIGEFDTAGGKPSLNIARWSMARFSTYLPAVGR